MALLEDLKNKVSSYFKEPYEVEDTSIVPGTDYSKLTFGNKGLVAELSFLFIDIRKSSELHDKYGYANAAKIYQSFHDICLRIIEEFDGKVRAFDGDRIMGVFSGDSKRSNAAKAALKIRWSITNILNPNLKQTVIIGCGIDVGKTLITKVGKGRDANNNDLIWIGKACNYASHLTNSASNSIIISEGVYNWLNAETKFQDPTTKLIDMWKKKTLTLKNNTTITVYESTYSWSL
jgi:adenylate cyclase